MTNGLDYVPSSSPPTSFLARAAASHFLEKNAEDAGATVIFYKNSEQNFWRGGGTALNLDTELSISFPVISPFFPT